MEHPTPDSRAVFRMAVSFEMGLAVLAIVLGWGLGRPPLELVRWDGLALLMGLLAALPLLVALLVITHYPRGPLRELDSLVRRLVIPLFRDMTWAEMLMVSIAAGVGEELLFRGVIQAALAHWTGSTWVALAIASVLFGLAHMISRTYAVLAAAVGAYLGGLWLVTDNLLAPIITHAAYDFVALLYLVGRDRQDVPSEPSDEKIVSA